MSSFFGELRDNIDKGREGFNRGIPIKNVGLDKLGSYVSGIQPGRYDLVGGNTGTGKTGFVDLFYVVAPLLYLYDHPDDKFDYNIIYNSLEIGRGRKLAKLACVFLYLLEDIVIDWQELLSYGAADGEVLSDEKVKKVDKLEPLIDFIESKITFLDGFVNPTRINAIVEKRRNQHGLVKHRKRKVGSKWQLGKAPRDKDGHIQEDYVQKFFAHKEFENLIVEVITDHIGLLSPEREGGGSKVVLVEKRLIDRHSMYRVNNRDDYDVSSVDVSQFNREIAELNRRKFEELTPQLEDFKGSGNTQENADTVFALFNPERYNIDKYKQYDLKELSKRFRSLSVLKNRNGVDMVHKGLRFIGECGHFAELPTPDDLKQDPNLYKMIMDLRNKTLYDLL